MDIALQTNSGTKQLEFRDVRRVGGEDYSCLLVLNSGGFCANRSFYFDVHNLVRFLDNLAVMATKLEGEALLRHSYEEDRISFKLSSLGHVVVSGFLAYEGECRQELHFCFETDQTVLRPLLENFRGLRP